MKFLRFLYINLYSFALLALAALLFLLPPELFLIIVKAACAIWAAAGAITLFSRSKLKTNIIRILAARNKNQIRPETFKKHTKTFCGQLVANLTLHDLRKTEHYSSLSSAEWKEFKRRALGKRPKAPSAKAAGTVGVLEEH